MIRLPKIYIARHGQDEDNSFGILNGHRDTQLTDIGVGQAEALANAIEENNLGITKIYSSPLKRAYQTAGIVASKLSLEEPEVLDLIIERDFGIMTGKPTKDIELLCSPEIIKTDTITYFLSPVNAETFPDLINRAKEVLRFINLKCNLSDVILLVSHGDIGKMIYAAYYNLDWKDVLTKFHFGNSEIILLSEDVEIKDRYVHKVEQYNL
ncbi:MAG: histidine phosphatase family protein [Candidatus Paceibacterota bacterium]|jgi:broad specificity phosphatase PhoE